jgi:hypothetical protein
MVNPIFSFLIDLMHYNLDIFDIPLLPPYPTKGMQPRYNCPCQYISPIPSNPQLNDL